VLGKDPDTSDIVLVNQNGISDHHCAITFEDDFKDINGYRLVIRDLKSSCGTSVEYDKQAGRDKGGVRRDFRWIVSGHDTPEQKTKTIVLELHKYLKFQIVVSRFDMESQPYVDSVNLFRQGVISMDNLFAQLGLPSRPPTEPPSGAHTPGTGAIYVKKKLGEGAFGVVTYFWDVSDGDEYALKEPSRKAIREKRVDVDAWKKEARIMARVSDVSRRTYVMVLTLTSH
jgi:serine/threonine-protein kinase Chk2